MHPIANSTTLTNDRGPLSEILEKCHDILRMTLDLPNDPPAPDSGGEIFSRNDGNPVVPAAGSSHQSSKPAVPSIHHKMDESHLEGISSLIRMSGSIPARARFIGEAMVTSSLGAITLGLVCGQAGSMFCFATVGPLVPFLVGSWTGYTLGLYQYWRQAKRLAETFAQQYPTLMVHALVTERFTEIPPSVMESTDYGGATLHKWILEGGLGRLSMSILAAQSCRNDVEELQRQDRQRLMEEYQEKMRETKNG